ncbi:hypothetical protein BJ165DRAFT_746884 [Panaeolus papilionaceus]|nr:hypothetical protein BJ165DRAFT_746884 [Panaeolus papilionaceus]
MENYRSLLPAVNVIGKQVASTPPTSQPVCFLGVDLNVYLQTDPRTARYSRNCLFSPDLLQFPDGSGRSALWLRPLFEFDGRSLSCTTRPPLGRVFTVFYPMNGRVLYAGQYTVSHVFPRNPKGAGYLISNKDPQDAKAIEVINTLVSSNGDPNGARILDHQKFYTGPVLQVGVVGLKFLSFDHQLHDILGQRFQASLPVERRNKFPNSSAVKSFSVRNQSGASNDDNLSRVKRRRM